MQLKLIKFILKILTIKPKVHHVLILFAPLIVFFRLNHLITEADLAASSTLTIGRVAHAESGEKTSEKGPEMPVKSAESAAKNEADKPAVAKTPEAFNPLTLDENQIKVLQAMADAQANKLSEEEIQKQKKLIELGEQKIAEQLDALQKVKTDVENKRGSLSKEEQANIIQTAKIYENMKPPAAADIFNKLEMIVLVQLVKHMDKKKASPIIAAMDPKKARALTIELLRAGPVVTP